MRPEIVQIHETLRAGDLEAATRLAREAYISDITDPIVLSLMAHRLEEQGDFDGALKFLFEASDLEPGDALIHANIGHVFVKMTLPNQALQAFNRALLIDPKNARAHHGAGLALMALGDYTSANLAQERAHVIDPDYPDPMGAIALIAMQQKNLDRARLFAHLALRLEPNEPNAVLVEARLLLDEGNHAGVIEFLKDRRAATLVAPLQLSHLERIYADAQDALGAYDAAFRSYDHSNLLLNQSFARRYVGPEAESAGQLCDRLQAYFDSHPGDVASPVRSTVTGGQREHVFLIGFPRSGTTLLEQVLASHKDIVALEEKDTLNHAIDRYFMASNAIDDLIKASDAELDDMRREYWARVSANGIDATGKVFIDKQPSLTLYIPLLRRLFPDAKVLFCIRDPRDVVLSCYRRMFAMNTTIFEFTRLDTLCRYYAKVMTLGDAYLARLPVTHYRHTHEHFIENFEADTRAICAFLDIPFDENMQNFVETANQRDIRTPSAQQVRAGLNSSGVGYWRNYRAALEPWLPILAPWVERFGYPAN